MREIKTLLIGLQMADRVVALTDTLNYLRHEFNGTAADVGDIADF